MFLLQIAQAPVVIRVANEKGEQAWEVSIPKYTLGDAIVWGAAIKAQYEEAIVKGLDERRAREVLALNPPIPPTINDLKRLLQTPNGAQEVLSTQLPKATVYYLVKSEKKGLNGKPQVVLVRGAQVGPDQSDHIRKALVNIGAGPLCHVAWEIADVSDAQQAALAAVSPPEDEPSTTEESEDDVADPLPVSGGTK
jgi:hypothetical protein